MLVAGNEAWNDYANFVVEGCRARVQDEKSQGAGLAQLQESWEQCVGPTRDQNDKVGKALTAAVMALRAYWTAAAADDKPAMIRALKALKVAAEGLPMDQFGGLRRVLAGIRI